MGADAVVPWAGIVPVLAYRTALRAWWELPEYASAEVYREALQGIRETEAALHDGEAARLFDQEVGHWWLTHEGACPLCGQAVEDLNAHLGRPVAPAGAVPGKTPKPAEPAQGRLL